MRGRHFHILPPLLNEPQHATAIKCCLISGTVAGSYEGSKLRIVAHACAVSALPVIVIYLRIRHFKNRY